MELTDSFVQQKVYHELGLKKDEINLEILKSVSEFLESRIDNISRKITSKFPKCKSFFSFIKEKRKVCEGNCMKIFTFQVTGDNFYFHIVQ